MKILTKPEKSLLSSSLIYGYEDEEGGARGHLVYWSTGDYGEDYYDCLESEASTCKTNCLYTHWINGWHETCG